MQLVNHGCHLHCNLSGQVHDSAQNCIEWHWKLDVRRITRYPALVLMNYYAGNKGEIAFSCLQCNLWMPALLLNPQSLQLTNKWCSPISCFCSYNLHRHLLYCFIYLNLWETAISELSWNNFDLWRIILKPSSAALKTADSMEYHLRIARQRQPARYVPILLGDPREFVDQNDTLKFERVGRHFIVVTMYIEEHDELQLTLCRVCENLDAFTKKTGDLNFWKSVAVCPS